MTPQLELRETNLVSRADRDERVLVQLKYLCLKTLCEETATVQVVHTECPPSDGCPASEGGAVELRVDSLTLGDEFTVNTKTNMMLLL